MRVDRTSEGRKISNHSVERSQKFDLSDEQFGRFKELLEQKAKTYRDIKIEEYEIINRHTIGIKGRAKTFYQKQMVNVYAAEALREVIGLNYKHPENTVHFVNHVRVV